MRIAQTILNLLKVMLRMDDAQGAEEVQTDGWLLEGDKINSTGVNLMGDPAEVLRNQMSLDIAIYAE